METHKPASALPFAILLVIAYLAFCPNRAERELVHRVAWSTPLASPVSASTGPLHGFRVGDRYGYVDEAGALTRLETVFYDVTLNDTHYSNYSKGSGGVVVRRSDGAIACSVGVPGWPLIPRASQDTVYVFSTDLLSVAEVALDGTIRWKRELGSLITCFAYAPTRGLRAVVGTVDGRAHLLDVDGSEVQTVQTPGSRISATYGCAASRDGRLVALVQGLGPQTLAVLRAVGEASGAPGGTAYRLLWSRALPHERHEEIAIRFSQDGRLLVVDAGAGADVYDSRSGRVTRIRSSGYLEEAVSVGQELVLTTRDPAGGSELVMVVAGDIVAARVSIPGDSTEIRYLSGHGGYFLQGLSGTITRVDVVRT